MKQKTSCAVVTFHTTAEAMAAEKLFKSRAVEGRLIAAPRALTADCGIAWRSPAAAKDALETALRDAGIDYDGLHIIDL